MIKYVTMVTIDTTTQEERILVFFNLILHF